MDTYILDRTAQFNDIQEFKNSNEYKRIIEKGEKWQKETFEDYVNIKIFRKEEK